MLHYTAGFLLITLLVALLGSTGIAVGHVGILIVALPLLLITSYIVGLLRHK